MDKPTAEIDPQTTHTAMRVCGLMGLILQDTKRGGTMLEFFSKLLPDVSSVPFYGPRLTREPYTAALRLMQEILDMPLRDDFLHAPSVLKAAMTRGWEDHEPGPSMFAACLVEYIQDGVFKSLQITTHPEPC